MPSSDKEAKLQALRAKRKAVEDAIKPDADAELDAAIAAEEQALADAEALARLTQERGPEGGRWRAVRTAAGLVCVARPDGAAFKRFSDTEGSKVSDAEAFVWPCILYPAKETFGRLYDAQPGILADVLLAACELAGARAAVQLKK